MITVFTPVYNRANMIGSLYESLKLQTYKKFEWLIVNDGSTDNIDNVVEKFKQEQVLNIRYFSQANGGKHRAINRGVSEAQGELFFIVDSDDTIKPNALELLDKYYQQIKDNDHFAGVAGYRCNPNDENVYNFKIKGVLDCSTLEYFYKNNQEGGIAEAFKTYVLKQYPFPDIQGEKFCAECLVWNRIAQKYIIRLFPDDIYVWNCTEDGLTKSSIKNRMKSPTYAMTIYAETLVRKVPIKRKIKSAINYWRFYFCKRKSAPSVSCIWVLFLPVGLFLHLKDRKIQSKE